MAQAPQRKKVVIIGAGFGGLYVARTLANKPVDVLLIDRNNFHTFTPLLYQVATCGLDPSEIAYPVRSIFRKNSNVQFLLGEVTDIDHDHNQIGIQTNGRSRHETYDYLVIAAGSVTNYFGNPQLEEYAFGLKSLSDAVILRNHILKLFEKAAWTTDPEYKSALTTLVVVGGGPTGLETAGALYELYNYVLRQEYTHQHKLEARVILVEATGNLLTPYSDKLRQAALEQLQSLGVEVILNGMVDEVAVDHITLRGGQVIPTYTLVWGAGVKASPIADMLNVPLKQAGRIPVEPTLKVIGHDNIYAVGDIVYLEDANKQPYPMLIPVANQQGSLVARNILARMDNREELAFRYSDKGIMATIGRTRAVAWLFYKIQLTGFVAWIAWLVFHLITLMGFRNRASVFFSWVWNYLTYDRSVRIILEPSPHQHELAPESTHDMEQVLE